MAKFQPQFSLLAMQLAVAVVAVVLGIRLYIEPRVYWRDLWILLGTLTCYGVLWWLIISAPWSARFFAIGFVFGAVVEYSVVGYYVEHDLIHYNPGTWTPEGYYPVSLPIERLVVAVGWSTPPYAFLPAMLLGMASSGVVAGQFAAAGWLGVRWFRRPATHSITG